MALTPPPPGYGQLHLHRLIGQSLGYHGSIFLSPDEKCISILISEQRERVVSKKNGTWKWLMGL